MPDVKTNKASSEKVDFKHVGVVGRVDSEQAVSTLKLLRDFLLAQSLTVSIDRLTAKGIGSHPYVEEYALTDLCQHVDLLIVVGGDGTLLSTGRVASVYKKPLLGVNRGRLGFLTDINPVDLEQGIGAVLAGEYSVEERFMLQANIGSSFQSFAINDVVLNAGGMVSMVEFELYIDGQFVYSQSSDGLIISTPTGSTAYALSGGGPIMHPSLDAVVIVPMFPHTLSSRPIVIDGNSEITIIPSAARSVPPQISCDGQENFVVSPGEEIRITKCKNTLSLVHPLNHEFYQACRSKLGWGKKL